MPSTTAPNPDPAMPVTTNNFAVYAMADLLFAAQIHELKVKHVDWEKAPAQLKKPIAEQLAAQQTPESCIDECMLATDPEGDVKLLFVSARREDDERNFIDLAADQYGLLGIYDSNYEPQTSMRRLMARGRPYLIPIVQQILADGKPRTAEEILEIGIAKGLLRSTTKRKDLYGHLIQYIERTVAHGRKPLIIQNPTDRTFTINQRPDDWPDIPIPQPPEPNEQIKQLIDKLTATSTGTNPTDFELAVCAAFEQLGYITTHIGGELNPDGIADAPLGPKAHRVVLECKTSVKGLVPGTEFVTEVTKHKDERHGDYCVVVGPKFGQLGTLDSELQAHKVALWTVADLVKIFSMDTNPYEMIPLFGPGRASNALDDILWERRHGRAKRVRTIADVLQTEGWKAQVLAARESPREAAPLLTEDAAMMLVDGWLAKQGAQTGCTRADVHAAFEFLTNPIISRGTYADNERKAIILCDSGPNVTLA